MWKEVESVTHYGKREETNMTKDKVESYLLTSHKDYERYVDTGNVDYLRDASEKLFTTLENFVEYKTGERVSDYVTFKKLYNAISLPLTGEERISLKSLASQMHNFARHGLEEPDTMDEVIQRYLLTHKKLENLMG